MKLLPARATVASLAAAIFAAFAAGIAIAQDYPSKTVRVVIPWPPGGGTTIAGRIVIQKVSESLGQQFIIHPWANSPEELGTRIKADYEKYGRLIKLTGAALE